MKPCECESSVCDHNALAEPDEYGYTSCPEQRTEVEPDYGLKVCKNCGEHYKEYREERYNEAMAKNREAVAIDRTSRLRARRRNRS